MAAFIAPQEYAAEIAETRVAIDGALRTLSPREASIICLRFGLTEDGCALTLREIGRVYGVRVERVRQIEAKALRKLRHPKRSRAIRDAAPSVPSTPPPVAWGGKEEKYEGDTGITLEEIHARLPRRAKPIVEAKLPVAEVVAGGNCPGCGRGPFPAPERTATQEVELGSARFNLVTFGCRHCGWEAAIKTLEKVGG